MRPAQPPGGQVRGPLAAAGHGEAGERAAPVTGQPREPRRPQPAGQGPLLDDAAAGPGARETARARLARRTPGRWSSRRSSAGRRRDPGWGVVRSPSHLNSGRNRVGRLAGRTSPASLSADRVRRTATRRSCRNSVSMSRMVPATLASSVSSSCSSTAWRAARAGMPGSRGTLTLLLYASARWPAAARAASSGQAGAAVESCRGGQHLADPLGLGLVAADRGHLEPGRQLGRRRMAHRGPVRPDPGDRLGVRVKHPQVLDRAGGPDGGQQGPDPGHRADHRGHRARRQVLHQGRPAQPARGLADQIPGRGGQHQLRGPRAGDVLKSEPGPVQPPVEGVQPGAVQGTRPPRRTQREPRRERGQHFVLAGLGGPIGRQLDDTRERLHWNLYSIGSRDAAWGDADEISHRKCS